MWRRPLLAAVMLLTLGGTVVLYMRREGRHLVVKPNMIVLATMDLGGRFFQDSSYVVRLGAHEGASGPIGLRVWYAGAGKTMLVSEREVRRAIEAAVAERRDATVEVVRGGALMRAPAPGVDVSLKLWGEGGIHTSVVLRCLLADGPVRGRQVADFAVSENYGSASSSDALDLVLRRVMVDASQAHCPVQRGRSEARAMDAKGAGMATAASTPTAVSIQEPPAIAGVPPRSVRDSAALAYVDRVNSPIVQLTMQRDTMYLRVGDAQIPELVLLMTGRRADGSVADRVVPLYVVENPRVAAMGAGGMRGLRVGTTRVVVRAMGTNPATAMTSGASAHFVVKVVEP